MAIIIVVNALLAVFVVGGMLALLGWGIASDRIVAAKLTERRRTVTSRRRQGAQRFTPAYTRGS